MELIEKTGKIETSGEHIINMDDMMIIFVEIEPSDKEIIVQASLDKTNWIDSGKLKNSGLLRTGMHYAKLIVPENCLVKYNLK